MVRTLLNIQPFIYYPTCWATEFSSQSPILASFPRLFLSDSNAKYRIYADPESSQRVGQNGPLLLQDFHLIDLLAHFDRERIPERVVHAKGAGAYGEFEVTHDISDLVSLLEGPR